MKAQEFTLTPHDPLVFGDGRPIDQSKPQLWPVPATLAAALNGWIGHGQPRATLRGPLLRRGDALFAPPPHDAMRDPNSGAWVGGQLERGGHRVLWPAGEQFPPLSHLLVLPDRHDGVKLQPVSEPTPLSTLIDWALGRPMKPPAPAPQLYHEERRTHVVISSDTLSAEAGGLFDSPGVRLAEGVSFAFAWDGEMPTARQVTFGGDNRLSELSHASTAFTPWSAEEASYRHQMRHAAYLRVQLLTPGLFERDGAYPMLPAWLNSKGLGKLSPDGPTLRLVALHTGRLRPFSGWRHDRETGQQRPRPVRRLVPAGAVYYFGDERGEPLAPDLLLRCAAALWLAGLDGPNTLFTRLGFGLALPGFTPVRRS